MTAGDRGLLAMLAGVVFVGLVAGPAGDAGRTSVADVTLDGYAEWKSPGALVVDGQRVVVDAGTQWKGTFATLAAVPLGHEVRVGGVRQANGAVLARTLDVRPNGNALFEREVQAGTKELESLWVREGEAFEANDAGGKMVIGEIEESGPRVDRVWRLVRTLAPPYVDQSKLRVYVIDNNEWNAMAMGNGAIWVFRGIMDDMSDSELAIVVGHELAHYTHEHSRRQMRKALGVQLLSLTALVAAAAIDSRALSAVAQLGSVVGFGAWTNSFGRDLEDQADRVGLRYAHEAGINVSNAPAVWQRFLTKYGDRNNVANFFFSDHSTAGARRTNLEQEIRFNYAR